MANYRPTYTDENDLGKRHQDVFSSLKGRILVNARAYYNHTYPHATRFDLITTSDSPSGRLDSLEYRAALIVYPNSMSREWKLLYKSNVCPPIEDAAFEICYWVEEDIKEVFDEVLEVGRYVAVRRRKKTTEPVGEWTAASAAVKKSTASATKDTTASAMKNTTASAMKNTTASAMKNTTASAMKNTTASAAYNNVGQGEATGQETLWKSKHTVRNPTIPSKDTVDTRVIEE
ncbi:hypothetical protein BU25DRAFT_494378 [Macroventuria anomochaeta]|uniref:Uncharacterized protein n=1 Tax=Macroventuria anomochaeta TaxID=301207 RepID=A0ACB6RNZ6_9PLEO|nr:uncharacterized protein BU25DRAFT_494378 [Macroventuria anomochaeta]KAF2623432.1 hypothetical protein BU25DRAFT_494378 [Macroventuria anomochaeta]